MGSNTLPYLATKPKLIFFTDFDGTITVDDSRCFPTKCRYLNTNQNRRQ